MGGGGTPGEVAQVDVLAGYAEHRSEIDGAVMRVLASGRYLLGPELDGFEAAFARYVGVAHAVGTASGTDALHLALRAYGVGAGDLVLTPSHTAVATVAAIEMAAAVPVFVDVEPTTMTIDPVHLSDTIDALARGGGRDQARPKAVVAVHLYGHPANMADLVEVAGRHDLAVVEDCAQSAGAAIGERRTGGWGDAGAFSFYPTKNLAALGDGGMVVTDDAGTADRLRLLRQYGWRRRFVSEIPGVNSRLDEIQAAVLRVRLGHLDADNARRRVLAEAYDDRLGDSPLQLPSTAPGATHAFHQYVVRCPDRDGLRAALADAGVGTAVHYPQPVHLQPAYRTRLVPLLPLPVTEALAGQVLSLPMYAQLDLGAVDRVAAAVDARTDGG